MHRSFELFFAFFQILDGGSNLTVNNFSFSARPIIGSFLQPYGTQYIRWSEISMAERLEKNKNLLLWYKRAREKRNEVLRQKQSFGNEKEDDIQRSEKEVN